MCDKELLVSYVYDELQGAERKAFQHHLVSCLECREEVQGLRATRGHLASWTAPERALDLTMPGTPAARAARRFTIAPGWALAAAAALVLAVGSALANVELSTGDGGVTLRVGRATVAAPALAPAGDAETRQALAAVQQRVRDLEAALAAQVARDGAPASVSPAVHSTDVAPLDEAELLRRVRQLISESEGRQQQQLATRLVQVMREMQAEHTMDLARIERTISQHQAVSSDEIFSQREEMKQLYRLVSQR